MPTKYGDLVVNSLPSADLATTEHLKSAVLAMTPEADDLEGTQIWKFLQQQHKLVAQMPGGKAELYRTFFWQDPRDNNEVMMIVVFVPEHQGIMSHLTKNSFLKKDGSDGLGCIALVWVKEDYREDGWQGNGEQYLMTHITDWCHQYQHGGYVVVATNDADTVQRCEQLGFKNTGVDMKLSGRKHALLAVNCKVPALVISTR